METLDRAQVDTQARPDCGDYIQAMSRCRTTRLLIGSLIGSIALVAAGCSSGPTHEGNPERSQQSEVQGSLSWAPCDKGELESLECATVQVPLDHAQPGEEISLALTRRKHTDPANYGGVVIAHPGGPGSSGLALPNSAEFIAPKIVGRYDWIGIAPRGVAPSTPQLSCAALAETGGVEESPYRPADAADIAARRTQAEKIAASCEESEGATLLPHLHTTDLAEDVESVRAALGVETFTFWGSSYGTMVGQVYATRYPERLDRMLLDSVVNAKTPWYNANVEQNLASEPALRVFLDWVAKGDSKFGLGKDAAAIQKQFVAKVEELSAQQRAGGKVRANQLTDAAAAASRTISEWPVTAAAFSEVLVKKEMRFVSQPVEPRDPNMSSVYLGVLCSETRWPAFEQMVADATRDYPKAPLLTWRNTWGNAPCAFWPEKAQAAPEVDGSRLDVPVLLVNEEFDPATLYQDAVATRSLFPSSRLLKGEGGNTHTSVVGGAPCVQEGVAQLFDDSLPPRATGSDHDITCPRADPPPLS